MIIKREWREYITIFYIILYIYFFMSLRARRSEARRSCKPIDAQTNDLGTYIPLVQASIYALILKKAAPH
jgi:hypothetical protein